VVSFGTAPSTAIGLEVAFRLGYGLATVDLEAHADLPASDGGPARTFLVVASLAPCLHVPRWWDALRTPHTPAPSPVFACALVTAGAFEESGAGIAAPQSGSAPFLAAGGRVGVEFPLFSRYFLLAHGDALGVFLRHSVQVDEQTVFRLPALVGQAGAGGGVRF
jgi:hypothetical protein